MDYRDCLNALLLIHNIAIIIIIINLALEYGFRIVAVEFHSIFFFLNFAIFGLPVQGRCPPPLSLS